MAAIPYGRQSVDERDVASVVEVLRGERLTQGPAVEEFERRVAAACDAPFAVAFSSGTAALHAAAFAAGVGPGDELLTSAITFAASANCGAYIGAKPTFADIDLETWNVTAETVARRLTSATRAVVPVHFAGLPAPVEEIRAAVGPDVAIVEDAAHALGAIVDGEPVGRCTHSDMAAFSFHPVKPVTSAEGGVVTTRSQALRERLARFRDHGMVRDRGALRRDDGPWYHEQHDLGFNYRLSDVHAALGRSQMDRLESFVERRQEIAARYREALAGLDRLVLPAQAAEGSRHGYHLFVVRHRGGGPARRALYDALREQGVLAQVHYIPVYRHPYYEDRFGYREGACPVAEEYYDSCLSLPCYPDLTDAEQDRVIDAVRGAA